MARILSDRSIRRRTRIAKNASRAKAVTFETVTRAALETETVTLRTALETVKATTGAVKVPNGTTRKIDRIVTDALAAV